MVRVTNVLIFSVVVLCSAWFLNQLNSLYDDYSATDVALYTKHYLLSHHLQNLGSFTFWLMTKLVYPTGKYIGIYQPLQCFPENHSVSQDESMQTDGSVIVFVASSKGGSVLSSFLAWELARQCGLSIAFGLAKTDQWPPEPDVPPHYEADILLAVSNGKRWKEYIEERDFNQNKEVNCVVFTRHPVDRFVSMFQYTLEGGESGLKSHARVLAGMESFEDMVNHVWQAFGKTTMEESHSLLMSSLESELFPCQQVKVDMFFKGGQGFDEATSQLFEVLRIREEVQQSLLESFQKHDLSRQQVKDMKGSKNHPHASGTSLSKADKATLRRFIMKQAEISKILLLQCKELGYEC